MKRVLLLSLFVLLASAVTVSAQSISDGTLPHDGYERTYERQIRELIKE